MDRTRTAVVGVFEQRDQADRAVEELRRAGFRDDQIGYAMRGTEPAADNNVTHSGSSAGEGLATGAVIGGLVGAAAALLIPGIGPVVAGGVLASVLGGAAVGAAAGGILGALVGMGIPEEEATYYQGEFEAGRILVTVRADGRAAEAQEILRRFGAYDVDTRGGTGGTGTRMGMGTGMAAAGVNAGTDHSHTHTHPTGETHAHPHAHTGEHSHSHGATANTGNKVELREEQLVANKQTVEAGEVAIKKEVVAEQRTVEVPVTREEVVIERTAVNRPADAPIDQAQATMRIPVREEQVTFDKQAVVREEISVSKQPVTETRQFTDTVRREEARIEQQGSVHAHNQGGTQNFHAKWEDAMPNYRTHWQSNYGSAGGRWEDYEPRYRYGWEMWNRPEYQGRQWHEVESDFRTGWERDYRGTPWDQAKDAVRHGWESMTGDRNRR